MDSGACGNIAFGKLFPKEHELLRISRATISDDLLIYGTDDENFVQNVCTIFQKCREKNVTLSAKNYI